MDLPLFPLQTVLFPGGLLRLKIFEARYLDMVGRCMREGSGFGVVALREGHEVRHAEGPSEVLEDGGTVAELIDVDSPRPGILELRCRGAKRFRLGPRRREDDGLWVGTVDLLDDDAAVEPEPELADSVRGLESAIETLRGQGSEPFLEPFRFDDAGWVANRWCEILPIPLDAKQRLMALDDPQGRLRLVDEFLRSRGLFG